MSTEDRRNHKKRQIAYITQRSKED